MRHFTSFLDQSSETLNALVSRALELKRGESTAALRGKRLGMIFFNPSLRTRVSFEAAMMHFGGHAISLSAGSDVWALETVEGVVMNGTKAEHIKDAARVLSRYADALAIRSFAGLQSLEHDLQEEVLDSFKKYASVPVISMESAMEHPCQALADMTTMRERLGGNKAKFVLTWAPHVRAIPMAVPNSALLAAANLGLSITLAHPEGFDLPEQFVAAARDRARSLGGDLAVTHDRHAALQDAQVVYAKNWSPAACYGNPEALTQSLAEHASWKLTDSMLNKDSFFMHCLPVRRNVEVSDCVLDGTKSVVYDQAENRMWAQAAMLEQVFSSKR